MLNGQLLSGNALSNEDAPTQLFGLAGSTGLYVSENSYYRNLSSTKLLGALVTAKAFEEGILDIDDPVHKYIGGLTGPAGELPPSGNGWLAKENCKVLTWTPYGETGYDITGGITVSAGLDKLYDYLSQLFQGINADGAFAGTIPKAGDTGMWGLAPCDTNITVRHLLSMSAGLVVDNFYGGGLLLPSLFHNPKITHTKYMKGIVEHLGNTNGYLGAWGLPYICGGTGAIPTSDDVAFNTLNSLTLTYGYLGVTGTILMYQPGTESYYGNEYEVLGPVLHHAIKEKNVEAQGYAGTTFAYVVTTYGVTSAAGAAVSGVLLGKGVWSSAALELGSTALIGAIIGASFSISGFVVDDIVDYISDRITTPIGATSVFFGCGQATATSPAPADYLPANRLQGYGYGATGYEGNTANLYFLNPQGPLQVTWVAGGTGATANLYIDSGYQIGYLANQGDSSGVSDSWSFQFKNVQRFYDFIDNVTPNTALKFKGSLGIAGISKQSDYVKLVKLFVNKGVYNGKRIVGKAMMNYIQEASLPTDIKMQFFESNFTNPSWNPFAPDVYDASGHLLTNPYSSGSAITWAYGAMKTDDQNSDSTKLGLPLGFTDKSFYWNGAMDTYWACDLNTGVYFTLHTQSLSLHDFNLLRSSFSYIPGNEYVDTQPTNANGNATFLKSLSAYYPLV